MENFEGYLTTQLVIRHMLTGDGSWKEEFQRRLKALGISDEAVQALYDYTRNIFLHSGSRGVEAGSYIRTRVFNLKECVFPAPFREMVREDLFTFSEVVKVVDEAEWYTFHTNRQAVPDSVWEEIMDIVRGDSQEHVLLLEVDKLTALGLSSPQATELLSKERALLSSQERYLPSDAVPPPPPPPSPPAPRPMDGLDWLGVVFGVFLAAVGVSFLGTGILLAVSILMEGMPDAGTRIVMLFMIAIALALGYFALRGGVRRIRRITKDKILPWQKHAENRKP